MTTRQQWMVVGAIVALLGGGLWGASYFLRDELRPLTVGNTAPPFSAITVDSAPKITTLDAFRGQVVLVNIWGTWCEPCRTEMPSIEALYEQMKPKGLRVLAVTVDQAGAGKTQMSAIRDFIKEYHLSFDVVYDTSGTILAKYQTSGVPESFVIARDGTIRRKVYAVDWNSDENRRLIESLLAEPAK